ncbi:DUF1223 domain-containing protein [Micromonospora sp. M12]
MGGERHHDESSDRRRFRRRRDVHVPGLQQLPTCGGVAQRDRARRTESGQNVFALGFHVDYWDDLGWPDQFADAAYTARQEAYARAFGTGRLYTRR